MKRILTISLALLLVSVLYGQAPNRLGLEPLNAKLITCHIATTAATDITIPMFIAPCNGYIATYPKLVSTSGSAAADTTVAQSIRFYVEVFDSIATAVTDTLARYVTCDTVSLHGTLTATKAYAPMTALYRYKMTWLSGTNASRIIQQGDVICLRIDFQGTCTAVTNLDVSFIFVPTTRRDNLPL